MSKSQAKFHAANAIKDRGTSKAKTRELSDRANPRGIRKKASETVTGKGGSSKGRQGKIDVTHPSQRGGVTAESKNKNVRGALEPAGRRSGEKEPGKGLVKGPARSRLRSVATVGGRTRTGRDSRDGARGLARRGSRTRGRG